MSLLKSMVREYQLSSVNWTYQLELVLLVGKKQLI